MKNKKRIVFDTSTLLGAFLFKNSVPALALKKAKKEFVIIRSEYTSDELLEVTSRKKFDKYLSKEERKQYISDFLSFSESIYPIYPVENKCTDPKDVPFLELATTAGADFIVSSDNDLLELHPFNEIQILKPSEFLKIV